MTRKRNLGVAVVLTVAIFIIDARTTIGYSDWFLYVIPIIIAAPSLRPLFLSLFPLADTMLLILGFFLSPPGGDPWRSMVNRTVGAVALWGMTFLIIKRRRAEEELMKHQQELEHRVRERTDDLRKANDKLQEEINERKRTEEELARSKAEFEAIFNSLPDSSVFVDHQRRILLTNPAFTRQFGYTLEEVKGKTTQFLYLTPEDYDEQGRLRDAELKDIDQPITIQYRRKNGSTFWAETSGMRVRDSEGRILGFAGISRDITQRRKMEEELKHLAHHDALTGLPNRRFFVEIAHLELAQARRNNKKAAVLFLDLDRFKEINDVMGHEMGDALLKEVAARLRAQVRESDTVARIGGDEFNIMLSDITHAEDSVLIARKIMHSLRSPYRVDGHEFQTSASLGISVYPDDADQLDTLLRYADIALYYAKEQGRNNFQFYNPAINVLSLERIRLESSLQQTLERGELVVYYQPQIDARTGKIVNVEALVRWRHPDFGLLEPKTFLPSAEETGFITAIDTWVMRTACNQIRLWLDEGLSPVGATVNLSARNFQDPELVKRIAEILAETGLPPEYRDVKITETVAMSNVERTIARLNELVSLGVHVSIDDFGTGYSSLSYLKRFPIQKLKIDQSFVRDIVTDPDDRAIISAVTAMAHSMKIRVLAEGVETKEQIDFLRSADCDELQGFAVGVPLSSGAFRKFMSGERE